MTDAQTFVGNWSKVWQGRDSDPRLVRTAASGATTSS